MFYKQNFPELLSSDQAQEYENYLKTSQQKKDIRGNEPTNLLEFIHYFNEVEPSSEDKKIVDGLVEFIEKKKGIPVAG